MSRRAIFFLPFVFSLAFAKPAADSPETRFESFVRAPTAKGLAQFKEDCAKDALPSPALEKSLKPLKARATHSVPAARALIFMLEHCADGALAEDLIGLLGVEMLTASPRTFLAAISAEGAGPETLAILAGATGRSGESVFADCDARCLPKVKKFFEKKVRALKAISASGTRLEIKSALIEEIRNAEKSVAAGLAPAK